MSKKYPMPTGDQVPVAGDVLPDIASMALVALNEDTPKARRRIRTLIDAGLFPAKKVNGRWISRHSWINKSPTFAEPEE